jgi:hypothetical protein
MLTCVYRSFGIQAVDLLHFFDIFYRADSARSIESESAELRKTKAEMTFFRLQHFTPRNLFDELFIAAPVSLASLDILLV